MRASALAYATPAAARPSALDRSLPIASRSGATMHEICLATGRLARAARRRDATMTTAAARALAALAAEHHMPKVRWHARAFLHWNGDEPLASARLDALLSELDFAVAAALAQLSARLSTA
jgi:hypothetical protein